MCGDVDGEITVVGDNASYLGVLVIHFAGDDPNNEACHDLTGDYRSSKHFRALTMRVDQNQVIITAACKFLGLRDLAISSQLT